MSVHRRNLLLLLGFATSVFGCGSRTDARRALDAGAAPAREAERCNGLDDDGVNGVDDPFRDDAGRYVTDLHCGACNQPCMPRSSAELITHCGLIDELPRCVAERCAIGYGQTREGRCSALEERLCLPCANDNDCGSLSGARCTNIAGEARCSIGCGAGCPRGYACDSANQLCVPEGGSCSCSDGRDFELACAVEGAARDAGTALCVGRASCVDGVLSACRVSAEVCDHDDNDCDGLIDEGFADARGAYSLNQEHCGECGVSCLEDTGLELQLACGGDPFAPSCMLACPDAIDGIAPGDLLDGDLDVNTGCECTVQNVNDVPGPYGARDGALDVNCDGADGDVLTGFYVATDGDDGYPGSPTRPLRTIGLAIARAHASLTSRQARPHVYVAGGVYAETLQLADGVQLHGGYRRDFRALDPNMFTVELRAPANTAAPGGAAMVGTNVGVTATTVEGIVVRGLDATASERAAIGIYLERPGANLALRSLYVRAGLPGEGVTGVDGPAGASPTTAAQPGGTPRAANEGSTHRCIRDANNVVRGGAGGASMCGAAGVQGGAGGDATCPTFAAFQSDGSRGQSVIGGAASGAGGAGGQDAEGPIQRGPGCDRDACCGLADFSVPTNFSGPRAGDNGRDGDTGAAGVGCADSRGSFAAGVWTGAQGTAGQPGQPGGGGGGGGAGGGVELAWTATLCEFVDGLGGGGGGGGGGGCGGGAGVAGTSGAPSVALLLIEPEAFTIDDVSFVPSAGGRGGPGGAGGDGGLGGAGAAGGNIAPALRTTPTLAGTYPGARGGSGGTGGPGGGGGGGCGGASAGIWIVGAEPSSSSLWRARNIFQLGGGGGGGAGGGGAQTGSKGRDGEALDVVVQR